MAGREQTPPGVIRAYLAIAALYTAAASMIWGVNTLFLLDAGLDILGVFIANAVFTGAMSFFEIPTGVLADTRGRRLSFLLSVVILLVGTLGYVAVAQTGGGLLWFCAWSVVLGLGYTFYSGAVEAWLVDALEHTGFTDSTDLVFARGSMVSSAAMVVGTVGGGVLGSVDLALPFVVRAALLGLVFLVGYRTMHDLGFKPRDVTMRDLPGEMRELATSSIKFGWRDRPVRLLVLISMVPAIFMSWSFHSWQPYFLGLLGSDAVWVAGVIAAAVSFAAIGGNYLVEQLSKYCGRRTTLVLWAVVVQSIAMAVVGLTDSFWLAVGAYLFVMGASGVARPVKQAYLHKIIGSKHRATIVSFDSLVSNGGSMAGQAGLGYVARGHSIAIGYVISGGIGLLALPMILGLRRMGHEADRIVGTAGKRGACAGSGLPGVAALDTAAHTDATPPATQSA